MGIKLVLLVVALGIVVFVGIAGFIFNAKYRTQMTKAEAIWAVIAQDAVGDAGVFDPASIADLPEIAQRYFNHAIEPGTPLRKTVVLGMSGSFVIGEKDARKNFDMVARQILDAPFAMVWMPEMSSGVMKITGADSYSSGEGSMRIWMQGVIPLVQMSDTPDINQSGAARPMIEAIWSPASFLPENGAKWVQEGPDKAIITFADNPYNISVELTLSPTGAVLEAQTMRWSNANPEQEFRFQPFGGVVLGEARFDGFTIPSLVEVGNHFGTEAYFPFFKAKIDSARYY